MLPKKNQISKLTHLTIFLLFIASQSSPDNKFIFLTYFSLFLANSIVFLKFIYSKFKQSKKFYYISLLIYFLIIALLFQYQNFSFDILKQIVRIIYPWYLTLLFIFLIRPYEKSKKNLFNILSFSSLAIYLITLPDIISILFRLINYQSGILYFLKGATLIYPESNTTSFLILFSFIFRNELKLTSIYEKTFIFMSLLLTVSRSSIIIIIFYYMYEITKFFLNRKYYPLFNKLFSRFMPFIGLSIIFLTRIFLISNNTSEGDLFNLTDISFMSRLGIIDYLDYFFNNLNINNFHNLFLGFGWIGQSQFGAGVIGTKGHTLLGMIPELGLIYIVFIFIFFYRAAFKSQIAESLILTLALTIFIPISYIMPIFCLIIAKEKFMKLIDYENQFQNTK